MNDAGDVYIAKPALTENLGSFKLFKLPKCVSKWAIFKNSKELSTP